MARSLVLAQIQINGVTNPSAKSVMLMSGRILRTDQSTMTYNGSLINCTTIQYMEGDGARPTNIIVTQAASDIKASVNTANTTNSITELTLTKKNSDGTTQTINFGIGNLLRAYAHPDSTFDSLVMYEDATASLITAIKADQTVGAIVASLNS